MDAMRLVDLDILEARARSSSRSKSSRVSAPAMHPVHCCMSRRVASSMSGSATTSLTAKRPPGRRTRAASRKTRGLSPERLITQLEMITSIESSGSGTSSIVPLSELDVLDPGLALVSRGRDRASRRSCRGRRPCPPGRLDALRAGRRSRRPSPGRAPSRPRGDRRRRWGCRSRARRAARRRAARRAPRVS